jgi:DNA-binding response OmpR family regulator
MIAGVMQPMIIIIEHDHSNRELLAAFLEFEGFRILTTETSDTVINLVQQHHPARVLLDAHLPGTSSLDLHDLLKNDQSLADISVIA